MPPPIRVQIANIKAGLNTGVSGLVADAAFASFSAIVFASPVLTGRFRGNWQVSINDRKSGETGSNDKAGQSTVAAANQFFANYQMGEGTKANIIVFTNNVPYAVRLNEGHSGQAKAGFVEKGLRAGLKAVGGKGNIFS